MERSVILGGATGAEPTFEKPWHLERNREKLFTLDQAWSGGHFEVALNLGEPSNERLRQALVALWTHPTLQGCYLARNVEPEQQRRLEPVTSTLPLEGSLHGIAHLPNGTRAACLSVVTHFEEQEDWLLLGVPMGALSYAYPVGAYPFEDGTSLVWRDEVDEWLRNIGEAIFKAAGFKLGLIGHEATDDLDTIDLTQGVPQERWNGYLVPEDDELKWYPPTEGAPAVICGP